MGMRVDRRRGVVRTQKNLVEITRHLEVKDVVAVPVDDVIDIGPLGVVRDAQIVSHRCSCPASR
jgi:hypothetical protein